MVTKISLYIFPQRNPRYAALVAYLNTVPKQKRHEVLRLFSAHGLDRAREDITTALNRLAERSNQNRAIYTHLEQELIADLNEDRNRERFDLYFYPGVPNQAQVVAFLEEQTGRLGHHLSSRYWLQKARQLLLRTVVIHGYEDKNYQQFIQNLYGIDKD